MSKKTKAWLIRNEKTIGGHDKYAAEKYYGDVKQCPYCLSWIGDRLIECPYCHISYPEDGIARFEID